MRYLSAAIVLIFGLGPISSCGSGKAIHQYNLGVEAAQRGDLDEAIERWHESLAYHSEDPDARYNLGQAYLQKGRYEDAERQFRAAEAVRPDDHELQYALGRALEMQGDDSGAKKAYRFAIDLKPNFHSAYTALAAIVLRQELFSSAEQYASEALRFAPRDEKANLVLAETYYRQTNYQAAYAQLISSRSFLMNNPRYLLLLGMTMNARHMYADALETLRGARDAGEGSTELYRNLGIAAYELRMLREAEEYFRLSLFRDPSNAGAWIGLARTRHERGDKEGSLEGWRRAHEIDPRNTESCLGLAIVLMQLRDIEQALAILSPLASRPDAPPLTRYYLGHALMRLGRTEEAKRAFETFLTTWSGEQSFADEVREILFTL